MRAQNISINNTLIQHDATIIMLTLSSHWDY